MGSHQCTRGTCCLHNDPRPPAQISFTMVVYGGSSVTPFLQLSPPVPVLGVMLDTQSLSYDRLLCGLELSASHPSTRTPPADLFSSARRRRIYPSRRGHPDCRPLTIDLPSVRLPQQSARRKVRLAPQFQSPTVTGRTGNYINLASRLSITGSHVIVIAYSWHYKRSGSCLARVSASLYAKVLLVRGLRLEILKFFSFR